MSFTTSTDEGIRKFVTRHRELLAKEREAEIERTSLLLTNCPPSLLEQKGLALGSLGVANINIGLGGKTCVDNSGLFANVLTRLKRSLVELERPTAYSTTPLFPPHTFRYGHHSLLNDILQ